MHIRSRDLALRSLVLLLPFLVGCTASVGAGGLNIPPDAAKTCATQCEEVGLELSAVAIMAGTVGCVCEAPRSDREVARASATVGGGMTALLMHRQAQQRQQVSSGMH